MTNAQPTTPSLPLPLPPPFTHTHPSPTLISQGAEALIYHTTYLTSQTFCCLKHRPAKPYRHPLLDAKLTRHRILSEARALVRLRREGIKSVPAVYALDWEQGWLCEEWVEGVTVKEILRTALTSSEGVAEGDVLGEEKDDGPTARRAGAEYGGEEEEGEGRLSRDSSGVEQRLLRLMWQIGDVVGRVHSRGVVHGDLTTSNLMVRGASKSDYASLPPQNQAEHPPASTTTSTSSSQEVILIDFGLASQSNQDEDRAVDLYVLERAFGSTHPRTEELWKEVLRAYGSSYKGAGVVIKRLEEVRMRGRKKIMIG